MSAAVPERPADPFNTDGLVPPPRAGDDTVLDANADAEPGVAAPSAAAGGAGASPMTQLLGVVDPTPAAAIPPAPADQATQAADSDPGTDNGTPDAGVPSRPTSAVDGAPAVQATTAGGAATAPVPAPSLDPVPAEPVKATSAVGGGPPFPASTDRGPSAGKYLGPDGTQATPEAGPDQIDILPSADQPKPETSKETASPPVPDRNPPVDPTTPPPRIGDTVPSPAADPNSRESDRPAPTGADAVKPPQTGSSIDPTGAKKAGDALQDEEVFRSIWGGGAPSASSGPATGSPSGQETSKAKETGRNNADSNGPQPTGLIVTTWTAPDGTPHTGTETPRGAGAKSSDTASGAGVNGGPATTTTSTSQSATHAAASGKDEKKGDDLKDDQPREGHNDGGKDGDSKDGSPSIDNGGPTSFSINPSSSYIVVTGTSTLTGSAAISAIKAGAMPLGAEDGTSKKEKDDGGGPGSFVIAGIVAGVVAVILLGCWIWYRIRKKKASNGTDAEKKQSPFDHPSEPRSCGPGHRGPGGNETDWTDSGFDFIDDPVSATSTQIRNRRSTIAAYHDRNGMHHYPGGRDDGDPFDDMDAREYANVHRGDGNRMETLYDPHGYTVHHQGYDQHQGGLAQHGDTVSPYAPGAGSVPVNPPQGGQLWRTEDPFADASLRYEDEREQPRGPSPLQDLPLSPPGDFASAQSESRSRRLTPPLTNPYSSHENDAYSSTRPSADRYASHSQPHKTTANSLGVPSNGHDHLGYQSHAGTQYGDTALYDAYDRYDNAYGTATADPSSNGGHMMPLETGLPAKTPATGALLPWLADDKDDSSGVPPVTVAASNGQRPSSKNKEKKHKKSKSKDKKKSKSKPSGPQPREPFDEAYDAYDYDTSQPHMPQFHPRMQGQGHAGPRHQKQDPFSDCEVEPHPVRAAMAATPAVARMQMRQRKILEVPIPNFR